MTFFLPKKHRVKKKLTEWTRWMQLLSFATGRWTAMAFVTNEQCRGFRTPDYFLVQVCTRIDHTWPRWGLVPIECQWTLEGNHLCKHSSNHLWITAYRKLVGRSPVSQCLCCIPRPSYWSTTSTTTAWHVIWLQYTCILFIGVARYLKPRCDTYRNTWVTIRYYVSRYFVDAQTNRLPKRPKDKRPDSDRLLCFKTISFIINTTNQLNKKNHFIL